MVETEIQNIIFEAGWSEYEEYDSVVIFEKDGKLYLKGEGHIVGYKDKTEFREISQQEALEIMLDYEEHEIKWWNLY